MRQCRVFQLQGGFVQTAPDPNMMFTRAEKAFKENRYASARSDLKALIILVPGNAQILHLLALVEKADRKFDDAARAFTKATTLAPRDAQIANNAANFFAQIGQFKEAVRYYNLAINAAPTFTEAKLNRAITLGNAKEFVGARRAFEALQGDSDGDARFWSAWGGMEYLSGDLTTTAAYFDRALNIDATYTNALRGRARIAQERGEACANALIKRARALMPNDLELVIAESEVRETAGLPDPQKPLIEGLALYPDWIEGHRVLSRMRWEAGDGQHFASSFETAIVQSPQRLDLWTGYIETLAASGLHEQTIEAVDQARKHCGDNPKICLIAALHCGPLGDWKRAEAFFQRVPDGYAGKSLCEAQHLMRAGDLERSAYLLDQLRAGQPDDIMTWSLTGLIWRMMSDDRAAWLHEQSGLVGFIDTGLSAVELAQIAETLRQLHKTSAHPIGQSLRSGTQTKGRLFERLEPEVAMLRSALMKSIRQHWQHMPAYDERHPLLRHRRGNPHFAGSWSVRLTSGGFHVAHVHPAGILSSACYLHLPEKMENNAGEGDLLIGAPPLDLGLTLPPLWKIQPAVGHVALFPSTLHHSTVPFGTGERLTAAFDILVS
jgi:tetratricopeptide (TPR) repeat protein